MDFLKLEKKDTIDIIPLKILPNPDEAILNFSTQKSETFVPPFLFFVNNDSYFFVFSWDRVDNRSYR